jgi:hypothetical protein
MLYFPFPGDIDYIGLLVGIWSLKSATTTVVLKVDVSPSPLITTPAYLRSKCKTGMSHFYSYLKRASLTYLTPVNLSSQIPRKSELHLSVALKFKGIKVLSRL